jgi:phospholipase/carboxylesterase
MSDVAASEAIVDLGGLSSLAVGDRDVARIVVVLLHGFAMTPRDLSPFAHSLGLPAWFLFPEGPLEASVIPPAQETASRASRAWWHIDPVLREQAIAKGPRDFAVQHPPDLPKARARIDALLDAIVSRDVLRDRPLIVGGFSQGGMLTCDTLLRAPRKQVSGVALLSASRLAYADWPPYLEAGNMRGLPVLVSHGEADADLAFLAGVALKDCLVAAGANVTWVPFEGGHEIPLVVWRHLRKFATGLL